MTTQNRRDRWRFLVWGMVFLLVALSVDAHETKASHAQLILRDGQAELHIYFTLSHVLSTYKSERAWLLGDIKQVMSSELSEVEQQEFLTDAFSQTTILNINDNPVVFEESQYQSFNNDQAQIVLYAQHHESRVNTATVSFPLPLGYVQLNVVKPRYFIVNAGEQTTVQF